MALDLFSLNTQQHEAVITVEGPLLLLAGAGTGKTRALTYRIAHLVNDLGIAPYEILAITFTNKAAAEMRERLTDLLGTTRGMWVLTFHALCVRLLRAHGELLGYGPGFTIYDDDDSKRLVKEICAELEINTKAFSPAAVRSKISTAKNELISPSEYAASAKRPFEQACARVYAELQRRLMLANAMDFDDLLVQAWQLLHTHAEVLDAYQERFRYISIDEYQDTNRAQYALARLLAAKYENIMVVGDDDQSIYSWRGADVRNILEFEHDYPEAKVLKLEHNYRSTASILNAANAVIANNRNRKEKRLFTEGETGERVQLYLASDERDEGRWIAGEIERLVRGGRPYDDFALFYRTNAQSRMLEDMLLRAGVPYRIYGGTRFFDREEIRDVMAYLKLVVNPRDDMAAKRVINKPRRGIGNTTVSAIEDIAYAERISFMSAASRALEQGTLKPAAAKAVGKFVQLLNDLRGYVGELRSLVEIIVERSGLLAALGALPQEEAIGRIENVREFYGVASEFAADYANREPEDDPGPQESTETLAAPVHMDTGMDASAHAPAHVDAGADASANEGADTEAPTPEGVDAETSASTMLIAFMEWLALRSDLDTMVEGERYVKLMTVHSAKGLEFKVVFIAGLEEGIFPHMMSFAEGRGVEEERRLAYVALTRARELLYLSHAQQRSLFGSTSANPGSRFVAEIPAELIKRTGVGSLGISGQGWEKRGSRQGIFGSGERRRELSATGGPSAASGASSASGAPQKALELAAGTIVEHKVFGRGRVLSANDSTVEVQFEQNNKIRKLLIELAPLVKV